MKILITGICGFVGSALAECLIERHAGISVSGIDNLMRPGSETNRTRLRKLGVAFVHGDIRAASDFECLPAADWVIDAAANPSVLAGVRGSSSSRQLFEHNLIGRGKRPRILQGARCWTSAAQQQPGLLDPRPHFDSAQNRW